MHHAPPPTTGLMQFATQAKQMGEDAKHRRLGLVFQTVSAVSVVVMGVIASAKLYREVFGHSQAHAHGHDHPPSHVQRVTKAAPEHEHGPKPSHGQRHPQGGHGQGRGEATRGR